MKLDEMKNAFKTVLNKFKGEEAKVEEINADEVVDIKFVDLQVGDLTLRVDAAEDEGSIEVGQSVVLVTDIDGEVATEAIEDGEYLLPDGTSIVVVNSEVTGVISAEVEDELKEDEKENEFADVESKEDESKEDESKEDDNKADAESDKEDAKEEVAEVDLVAEFSKVIAPLFDEIKELKAKNEEFSNKLTELENTPASEGVKFQKVGFEVKGKELSAAQRAAMYRNK